MKKKGKNINSERYSSVNTSLCIEQISIVRIKIKKKNFFFKYFFLLAIIWKMIEEFEPPPWASETGDDDI